MLKISEHFGYNKQHTDYAIFSSVQGFEYYLNAPHKEDNIFFDADSNKKCFEIWKETVADGSIKVKFQSFYFIGLDRTPLWKLPVFVEPKLNNGDNKLDFVSMLMESLKEPENLNHIDGLFELKHQEQSIEVPISVFESMSLFIIVQYIHIVKQLVRKGLKKSYYTKSKNLNNRIRGKINLGKQLKENVFKNKLTHVACTYQEHGYDTEANQFLKNVNRVIQTHLTDNTFLKQQKGLIEQLHYIAGAFHQVSDVKIQKIKYQETNPFYKLYNQAIALGLQILKLADYNISQRNGATVAHPPFWIDMSKLFELYVYKQLRLEYPDAKISYHEKVHFQEPDFLIIGKDFKAVVDAKYKPRYKTGNPSIEDARQLSGYCRLNTIYEKLGVPKDKIIPAIIIYPSELNILEDSKVLDVDYFVETNDENKSSMIDSLQKLGRVRSSTAYNEFYMCEISLSNFLINN